MADSRSKVSRTESPTDDTTLGGYLATHDRPPAFEGPDGHPYTVSPEVERTPNLRAPYAGYFVFPRWATTGAGIVGHLETPNLVEGASRQEVLDALGALPLIEVYTRLIEALDVDAKEADAPR